MQQRTGIRGPKQPSCDPRDSAESKGVFIRRLVVVVEGGPLSELSRLCLIGSFISFLVCLFFSLCCFSPLWSRWVVLFIHYWSSVDVTAAGKRILDSYLGLFVLQKVEPCQINSSSNESQTTLQMSLWSLVSPLEDPILG